MVENILKAYLKICEYSRNNNKSYDDAFYQLEYKYFDFGRLHELSKLLVYSIFAVKFHYAKETHMMLVTFWRTLVKIFAASQHKRQRNKSLSRLIC